jgi:hypothetical protein
MKVLLTESQMNNVIEKLFKREVPSIISVSFKDKEVSAFDKGSVVQYTRTSIQVIVDPGNVCDGNLYTRGFNYHLIKQDLSKILDKFLKIDISRFKAKYSLELYVVNTQQV